RAPFEVDVGRPPRLVGPAQRQAEKLGLPLAVEERPQPTGPALRAAPDDRYDRGELVLRQRLALRLRLAEGRHGDELGLVAVDVALSQRPPERDAQRGERLAGRARAD